MSTAVGTPANTAPAARTASRVVAWALCVAAAGLELFAALRSGGYFAEDYLAGGALALVAASLGLLATTGWRATRPATVALLSLVGLGAWYGASAAWSPDPVSAKLLMARTLGYAAVFLVAMLAASGARMAPVLLRLLVLSLVAVSVIALVSRLRPEAIRVDPALLAAAQGRLAYPITYWNGLGAIAGMAVMGCIGLSADAREAVGVRAAAAAGGTLSACAVYLTISRGADLALAVAVALVFALSPRRLRLSISAAVILAAAAAGVLVLRAHPVLVDQPGTIASQSHAGGPVLLILLMLAAAAAGAHVALARRQASRVPIMRSSGRIATNRRPTAASFVPAIVVALLLVAGYASGGDRLEGGTLHASEGLHSFVDRQYAEFMRADRPVPAGQARLTSSSSTRSDAYRVALAGFRAHPLRGDGGGGYGVRWIRERRHAEYFRNAHSLELEVASDLGVIGLLLLGGLLVPMGQGIRGMRRRRGQLRRSQATAASGVLLVWMAHTAIDWDWQMGAVTIPALLAAAALLAPSDRPAPGARAGTG